MEGAALWLPNCTEMTAASSPATAKRAKVFLSSTKQDLNDERTAAWLALRPDYDVVRMEEFKSATHDGWEECLKQLSSCDIYVLLIGHEYGSALADTGRSYTHAEYHLARELGLPIFAFVKHGFDAAWAHARDALRLYDFYEEVRNTHHVMYPHFRDTEELAESIWDSLRARPSKRPAARPVFFSRKRSVHDPWTYAIGHLRRNQLAAHPFLVCLVDTQIALADRIPDESRSPLLEKALAVRWEISRRGADAIIINELIKWAKDDAERFILRVDEVGSNYDAILCFVHGRYDYPKTSAFANVNARVGIWYPAHLTVGQRHDADYIEYKMKDIVPCTIAARSVQYLDYLIDEHVTSTYRATAAV
jgi:hypothetical protein